MAVNVKIVGMDKVIKNLNKEVNAMKGKTVQGLIAGALYIRLDMGKISPLVPVDLRNLDHSWFITAAVPVTAETGAGRFQGNDAGQLGADHATAKSQAKAVVSASRQPLVVMGFSANYAAKVHETERAYKRPGAGAKFLQSAIDRNTMKVKELIAKYAHIK